MAKSAQQMSANWTAAMQSPTTSMKYKQGIANTTVNPMALAASPQAQQLYATNTAAAVSSGKMAAKLNSVSPQLWKDNASTVGAASLSSGATKAKPKVDAHFNKWAPIYQQAHDAVQNMPKGGASNALARVAAAMNIMMAAAGRA
jgi:hypothetical protein